MRFNYRLAFIVIGIIVCAGSPAMSQVIINEIMYNSAPGPGGADVEYIELYNAGSSSVSVNGWFVLDDNPGHPRCYLSGSIEPGSYLVIAADLTLFNLQYPDVQNYNNLDYDPSGQGFSLGNNGDTVNLHNPAGLRVDFVEYDDGGAWPNSADGDGPSLELIHAGLDNNLAASWDASDLAWGTPGELNSAHQIDTEPTCRGGERDVMMPTDGVPVTVTAEAYDAETGVTVTMHYDPGLGYYLDQPMFDDGQHGDGAAGDSIFGATIPAQAHGTVVRYYSLAVDGIGQGDTWPNDAPANYRAYTVGYEPPAIRINEVMADNVAGIVDEAGEHEDWLELYNADNIVVNLGGMYLSDSMNSSRLWALPEYELAPGEYLLVWADKDTGQGIFHADMKFSANGETAALFDTELHGNVPVHGFTFGLMTEDVSVGYLEPGDDHPEYLATPTPASPNNLSALYSPICINEFQTTSQFGGIDDWVEIFNRGDITVDISGWLLSDTLEDVAKWAFPAGTVLEPGERVTVYEDALGFGFSSEGLLDIIMLTAADSTTGKGYMDFEQQIPDYSYGRFPDGGSDWLFCAEPTPNIANANPVGIDDPEIVAGAYVKLHGSYPNPFNPSTEILFELGDAGIVELRIFAVDGRLVRTLLRERLPAGNHAQAWDGRNDNGDSLPSGIYLARVETVRAVDSVKLMMLK
ncbi:MAG: hypothetical protein GY835_07175 [bacterium]|nr:hypothetical protein [bacterium]